MRKIILTFLSLTIGLIAFAQIPNPQIIQAEFKYNQQSFQQAIQANNIVLTLSNLQDGKALENFNKTLGYYKAIYVMKVGEQQANGLRECQISFINNNVQPHVLFRLFLSNGMSELTFDGKKTKAEEFFNNY